MRMSRRNEDQRPDKRRQPILRSISTATPVARVKTDMDITATSHTTLVQNDRSETSWTWIWLWQLFLAVAAIFATGVLVRCWVPESREQKHSKFNTIRKLSTQSATRSDHGTQYAPG